jgi:hypothetical protein
MGQLLPFVLVIEAAASQGAQPTARFNASLREELLAMVKADQELRGDVFRGGTAGAPPALMARLEAIDDENTRRMKAIIRVHGWPGRSLVGTDGSQAAFLLVQHARDPALQKTVLPLLESAYARAEVPGEAVALLTDRILVVDGKPQRYGTQTSVENGILRVRPVEDEATLDARRARMGMPPMKDYLRTLEEMYRLPTTVK